MNEKQIQEVMALVDEFAAALARETIPECRGGYAKARSAIESALREQVREVPEGWVAVERGALNMVINALRRDAEQGRPVRGEMADALSAAPTQPAQAPTTPELSSFRFGGCPFCGSASCVAGACRKPSQPAQAEQPKKSDCTECANADSWGLPDKAFCAGCYGGSHWSPLNRSSVNPNVKVSQPKAAQQEPVAKVKVHKAGGNAGLAWSAVAVNDFDSLPLLRDGELLYTAAAPQREPMTRDQRRRIIDEAGFNTEGLTQDDFAQEIVSGVERFHHITKKEQQ